MTETELHVPVMLGEVLDLLAPPPGAMLIDATADGGGHAAALIEAAAPHARLLALDRDPEMATALQRRFAEPVTAAEVTVACANFRELAGIVAENDIPPADAILFDLGISSFHFDRSGRGFSFARDEPLDMRFAPEDPGRETAHELLATRDVETLTALFRDFGEERFASRIARTIAARRRTAPLRTTGELLDAVRVSLPAKVRWRAERNAARIFQALRIAVNEELSAVEEALPQAVAALSPGGRLAVIAFHSLEDRIVKRFFRAGHDAGELRLLTRKPLRPQQEEVDINPRAASARLRAVQRL